MSEADRLVERRSRLSPAKRALLEKRLLGPGDPAFGSGVIRKRPDPDLVPLSFAQERLWFLDQLEPGTPVHNRPVALRLTGPLDVPALERSLGEIVRRHQVLRARFYDVGGRAVQTIGPSEPMSLAMVDLRKYGVGQRDAQARQLACEEARRPFDLKEGPLVRAMLLQLGGEEHVLVLVIHHIAFDGWSARVLVGELAALYQAFSAGRSSPLPELSIQYADFAHWQRQRVQGKALDAQLSYWREKLDGATPLNLPMDRPRPAVLSHRGARQRVTFRTSLLRSLGQLSQQEEVTLFMTLLAAFKVLLHRYTGQDDIVVGSPIAGRSQVETEGMIGFFVNTLVLRTEVSGYLSFRELLARVRETALGGYEHQDVPFEKLVEELKPERDMSRTPLFDVMFNLERIPETALGSQALGIESFELDTDVSQFDMVLELEEGDAGLSCCLTYDTDLFDAGTAARLLGHYETLLESAVADPDQCIARLPLLTGAERDRMLVEWNDTRADYPEDLCIHQLFEAQEARTPDAVAVVCDDHRLTYRELNARANQLARCLRDRGVGPEVLVGVCMTRSVEAAIAILGVLKAGGAWVPLDPTYPRARLEYIIMDSRIELIVARPELVELLRSAGAMRCLPFDLGDIPEEMDREPARNLDVKGLSADNLAYVIYTSGTTGRPKGVMVPHRGVVNVIFHRGAVVGREALKAGVVQASLSFDLSVSQLFVPLAAGGTVRMARDIPELSRVLKADGITFLYTTPSTLEALMGIAGIPDSLNTIAVGGEAVRKCLVQRVESHSSVGRMFNSYGPTEASISCTDGLLHKPRAEAGSAGRRRPVDTQDGPVTIGGPMTNMRAHILDRHLQPIPVGVTGELFIAGPGVARGYLGRPDLTAERFIPSPYGTEPGERLYKTGDLARYLWDGRIEFLGRMDYQVKIRGFRVESGEIETVLARLPGVRQAVVVTRDSEHDGPSTRSVDKRLVAYVVPATEPPVTVSELRRRLAGALPDYMIPHAFVMLDDLPLTPNGKVDRRALPAPDRARPELVDAYVGPRTSAEAVLTEIWQEVLGLEGVGVNDSFFELGGHSLLAIQVISRICDAFQKEVPLRSIFDAPTIAQLSAVVEVAEESIPSSGPNRSEPVSRVGDSTTASSERMQAETEEGA